MPASPAVVSAKPAPGAPASSESQSLYRIRWRPPLNILLTGTKPQYLLDELNEMGDCEIIQHSGRLPPAEEINPDFCYFSWDVLLATDKNEQVIRDVFIFVEDESELRIESLGDVTRIDREIRQRLIEMLESADAGPVLADATMIHEVLLNLATNAVQAMNGKGVLMIRLYQECLDRAVEGRSGEIPRGRYTVIEVADTGCGMDASVVSRAFDPFFTTKAVGEGTGMGLSIVLGIIQLIILCTGFGSEAVLEKARAIGITHVLMKPYGIQELGKVIRQVLDSREKGRGYDKIVDHR